nr:ankyrin repeat RF-like protein, putative [Ipomoea batatas]GMD88077.1 ankyrin repeat RF-like protein, putative [Ipomoea batatas]
MIKAISCTNTFGLAEAEENLRWHRDRTLAYEGDLSSKRRSKAGSEGRDADLKSSLPPPPPLDVEHANRWSNLKPPSPLTLDLDLNLKMPSNDVAEENGHCWLFDALRLGDDLCATAQKGAGEDERDEDREKRTARWRWGRWKRQRKFRVWWSK